MQQVQIRLAGVYETLQVTVDKYDQAIIKCQTESQNKNLSLSARKAAVQRKHVYTLYRDRAQKRQQIILQKICSIDELESTAEELNALKHMTRLFRFGGPNVAKVEQMTEALNTLTDDLCDITSLLNESAPDIDVSNDLEALEHEVAQEATEITVNLPEVPTDPPGENLQPIAV
ncbi:hypothetical protein OAU26_03675 [Mariniblastus sp.]|nr:hypothetical protein [Mariniblastus sp.]